MASNKLVVYGGAGALGRVLVQHFKAKGYVSHCDPFLFGDLFSVDCDQCGFSRK